MTRYKLTFLAKLSPQVWLLAIGRFLSELGTGFTLFYAPIFFVNKVGLSATSVGIALGSASVSGVLGRILSGVLSDSPQIGRRRTLLLSAAVSAIGSLVLAAAGNFVNLVIGNLICGLGLGLYWPANEAVVGDVTPPENRREAYALTRLFDNLGMGMGIVLGGVLIATTGSYRLLFIIDTVSFILFFTVVYLVIQETYQPKKTRQEATSQTASWIAALRNPPFRVYVLVNIIFTMYVSQLHSTLPIYFKNFVSVGESAKGFTETTISALFAWHLAVTTLGQLPIARVLRHFNHAQVFTISTMLCAVSFSLIWVTGIASSHQLVWATLALGVFGLAIASYTPSASSLVTDLAPVSQRGVYFSISSLCWAAGYFIGPPLGGWVLDQAQIVVDSFWIGLTLSTVIVIATLQYLNRMLRTKQ
ncbi:MDR family MFS transporter [Scytonema sp. PCC 10023]|uniref:MDR family MFS transporter n=1 Tax=Scytonema sp. PCC 10023 TaxID=1680591 RepID=UPI0039C70704